MFRVIGIYSNGHSSAEFSDARGALAAFYRLTLVSNLIDDASQLLIARLETNDKTLMLYSKGGVSG